MALDDERPYYGKARTVAGLLLFVIAGLLALLDAILPDYSIDSIPFGLLLGTGSLLLGVEGIRRVTGNGSS